MTYVYGVELIVAGDFNCHVGSRFYNTFLKFVDDNKLQLTDQCRRKNAFTFCSYTGTSVSWIDHILYSNAIDNFVTNCSVHYQYISLDHKHVSVTFNHTLAYNDLPSANVNNLLSDGKLLPDWGANCDN